MLPVTLVRHIMERQCRWPAVRVDRWLALAGCKVELWSFPFPHEVWNHVYEEAGLRDAPVMDYPVTGLRMRAHPRVMVGFGAPTKGPKVSSVSTHFRG